MQALARVCVLKLQQHLDRAGHAGRGFQVTDVALGRTDAAVRGLDGHIAVALYKSLKAISGH